MQQQPKFTIYKISNDDGPVHTIQAPVPQIMAVLVQEGLLELKADRERFAIGAGYFLALPVSRKYSFRAMGNASGTAILASYGLFPANGLKWLVQLRGIPLQLNQAEAIMAKLMEAACLCTEERPYSESTLLGLLDLIFGLAVESCSPSIDLRRFQGSLLAQDFLALVSRNIRRQHAVGFYAKALHVTPSHLNRTVKSATGLPAKCCLDCFLFHEARQLLADPAHNITEISDLLYFGHPAVFHRFFRRLTGTTPLRYRAEAGR